MNELFEEKKWIGEFFIKDGYDQRFVGEIDYSPEHGVILTYSITGNKLPSTRKILYGVLSTGEKCSLIGNFDPSNSGMKFGGGISSRNGRVGFICLVLGDFLENDELLYNINFSLTGMQEFFFPKGYKDLIKYSETPLLSIETNYGSLEVGNNAKFDSLHKDITSQIYSQNQDAQEYIKSAFESVENKYPNSHFMLKKDIAYRIHLKVTDGLNIESIYDHILDIGNLFSILILSPVSPNSIQIIKGEEKRRSSLKVYPSMALSKSTMELCLKEQTHFFMPITQHSIELQSVIAQWLLSCKDYSTLVSSIQNETGYRTEHQIHGELVVYGTQFEAISYEAKEKKKYEFPIDEYATKKIKDGVSSILNKVGESDIGTGISKLRNEIAHVGRPKKLMKILTMRDLVDLSLYFQLTILGNVLTNLGVNKEVINKYQDKFSPEQ